MRATTRIGAALALLVAIANAASLYTYLSGSVINSYDATGAAWLSLVPDMNATGWNMLSLETNSAFSDRDQAYAAGYLEGFVTADDIVNAWPSVVQDNPGWTVSAPAADTVKWTLANLAWMQQQIEAHNTTDPYWALADLIMVQLRGLSDGASAVRPGAPGVSFLELVLANMDGDLGDLDLVLNLTARSAWRSMNRREFERLRLATTHCSSLTRVTPDFGMMFSAHDTWDTFSYMLRYYKKYTFAFSVAPVKSMTFSSYPGVLMSCDDFYVTDQQLTVIETTNNIYNDSLYDLVTPSSVLSFVRTMIANRLATSGPSWVAAFSRYNSGTYNNQWIVADYKKFIPHQPLQSDLLWILEQVPGYIQSADVTNVLSVAGYWPSYNCPYFRDVWEMSGYGELAEKYGVDYTHALTPRAKIFRRDAPLVMTQDDMQWIMRYNEWQSDEFSEDNPSFSISARADLDPALGWCGGGLDSKITNNLLVPTLEAFIVSGPTHQTQPVFTWGTETACAGLPHLGQPMSWDYEFQLASFADMRK